MERFVEWEREPERKRVAAAVLKTHQFSPIPEFQFVPLPKTNPVLIGYRWKEYHEVCFSEPSYSIPFRLVDSTWMNPAPSTLIRVGSWLEKRR